MTDKKKKKKSVEYNCTDGKVQLSGATPASYELHGRKKRARPKTCYSPNQLLYLQVPKLPPFINIHKIFNSNVN